MKKGAHDTLGAGESMKLQTLMTSIWQHLLLMVLIIMFVKCCRALEPVSASQ